MPELLSCMALLRGASLIAERKMPFTYLRVLLSTAMLLSTILTGCTPDFIDEAVKDYEDGIAKIQAESGAWRTELANLQQKLDNLEAQAAGDAKKIIADMSNDVGFLLTQTLDIANLSAEKFLARFGREVRCNADFFRTRVLSALEDQKESLKFWKQHHALPPPPPQAVCQAVPSILRLVPTPNSNWVIEGPSSVVSISGYDFRVDGRPAIELRDINDRKLRSIPNTPAFGSRYELIVDFNGTNFAGVAAGARLALIWPNQPDLITEIPLSLVVPGKVRIKETKFIPEAPFVDQPETPKVWLYNDSQSSSGPFVITWHPGANEKEHNITVPNLNPQETREFNFEPHYYKRADMYPTSISLSNGNDQSPPDTSITVKSKDPVPAPTINVPNVAGFYASDAVDSITKVGLFATVHSKVDDVCNDVGRVMSQSPGSGQQVPQGSVITITVGTRPSHPCP